jgi:hypothetical protein
LGPRPRLFAATFTVHDREQHITAHTSNQRDEAIKKNLVSKLLAFSKPVKKGFVTGLMSPENSTEYYSISKVKKECRPCLGTDTWPLPWGWKPVLRSGRVAFVSRKNHHYFCTGKTKMTSVIPILLSDIE